VPDSFLQLNKPRNVIRINKLVGIISLCLLLVYVGYALIERIKYMPLFASF
jgi:hypothetical protein